MRTQVDTTQRKTKANNLQKKIKWRQPYTKRTHGYKNANQRWQRRAKTKDLSSNGPLFDSLWNCFLGTRTTQDHFEKLASTLGDSLVYVLNDWFLYMGEGARHLPKGIYKAREPKGAWNSFQSCALKVSLYGRRKEGRKEGRCHSVLTCLEEFLSVIIKHRRNLWVYFDGHGICPLQMVECCIKPKMSYESKV